MKILCVHQGFELYGSDRTFVSSVNALKEAYPDAEVAVLLPKEGPLVRHMQAFGIGVSIEHMWVLRKAYGALGLIARLFLLPHRILAAWMTMRKYDLVYVNTAVIADFMLALRYRRAASIIHVHELPTGATMTLIRRLLHFSRATLVFNSSATQTAFGIRSGQRQHVLTNGVDGPESVDSKGPVSDLLQILMIGRISSWKGQDLLLRAIASLPKASQQKVKIKIAGDAFENALEVDNLKRIVQDAGITNLVDLIGFKEDPADLYKHCDVVVVPSKKPEPFGLVAIEAMSWAKPVIAAAHGGLVEIVADRQTGLLFKPCEIDSLADAIVRLLDDPDKRIEMGRRGRERYKALFALERYQEKFVSLVNLEFSKTRHVI